MTRLTSFKINIIIQIIIALCLSFTFDSAFARRGCCAHHGGVAGCDAATGRLMCKDGTVSATCPCDDNTKVTPYKPVKMKPAKKAKATEAASTIVPVDKAKTKGCCAKHGGVAGCDKSTGYLVCKDGTQSATCKCP